MTTDPEKLAKLHMMQGAHIAMSVTYDAMTELQILHIDTIWEQNSPEWNASVQTLEGMKALLATRIGELADTIKEILDD